MKSTVTSFTIFILMLFCIVFSIKYLNTMCTKLQNSNIQIERAIESNSWDEAYKNSKKFMMEWEKYSPMLSIFSNHNEIDDVNNEAQKLIQHISYKNKEDSLVSLNIIKNSIYQILEMQRLNVQNLF